MRALSSNFWVIDLHRSWHSANQIPTSTLAYLQSCSYSTSLSGTFHPTSRRRSKISSSGSSIPSIRSPGIRKPRDWSTKGNGIVSPNSASTSRSDAAPELDLFLELVPLRMRDELFKHAEIGNLIEVVMDLGRKPLARFPSGDWMISEFPVNIEDLQHAISKVGEFSDDNRSGIDRSLHRISAIRNRKKQIIGLTCRVGRSINGSAEIVRDLVEGGGSILVIGPPGVGKTTLIREIARMLADEVKKHVVIVDTSNEIGGDGDVPHSGVGHARRMQVPNVNMQHNVMIEAVENHMPEAIIIDEIGTELEALAASTIAQRGVQLVATAHGVTVESILKNPHLQILVGGIESVTLGDDEARKRKVQKTILERKGPPTFTCAVEMISRTQCHVHHRLDATVDALLAGKSPLFEIRCMDDETCNAVKPLLPTPEINLLEGFVQADAEEKREIIMSEEEEEEEEYSSYSKKTRTERFDRSSSSPLYVYTYKILEADVQQVAKAMGLEDKIDITVDIGAADAILASTSELKQNPWIRGVAKFHELPVFVIKSNTMAHMVKAVRMILGMDSLSKQRPRKNSVDIEIEDDAPKRKPSLEEIDALEEVRLAIEYIVIPGGEAVELLPRPSEIVARQLELVESYRLAAQNSGTELNPRLQILPQKLSKKAFKSSSITRGGDGSRVARLPLLPE